MMLADVQLRLKSVSHEVKALRALVAETKEPEVPPIQAPLPAPREPLRIMGNKIVPSLDLEMEATPLESEDDDMEEREAGPWRTVPSAQKKRNKVPVAMKLKGTLAFAKRGSIGRVLLTKRILKKICRARMFAKLLKLSPDGIHEMVSALPPGALRDS